MQDAGALDLEGPDTAFLHVLEGEGEKSVWASGTWSGHASAFIGPVDARSVLVSGALYTYRLLDRGVASGSFTVTHLAPGAIPYPGGFAPGYGFAMSLRCDGPFDILGARFGEEAVIVEIPELDGIGAEVVLPGISAAIDTTANARITSEAGGFYMAQNGYYSGDAELRHPQGIARWNFFPGSPDLLAVPADAGDYALNMTRASVDGYWVAAFYGLGSPFDLEHGRQQFSVIVQENQPAP